MMRTLLAVLSVLVWATVAATAQTSDDATAQPAAERSAPAGGVKLAPPFESQTGGVVLRPPAGTREIRRGSDPDLVVEFVDEQRGWVLQVHRLTFTQPMDLSSTDGGAKGLLDLTAEQFRAAQVHVDVLRQDVVTEGVNEVGMLAMRYGQPKQRKLAQQAIIKADERIFYTLTLNSRSNVAAGEVDAELVDPQEREAVETFGAVLSTVKLLDRAHIKREQDERLRRTQLVMVNLTQEKVRKALIPEQWLRIVRDGRDIGYSYIAEEEGNWAEYPGVQVSTRMRTIPEPGIQADVETSMFAAFDRKREWWRTNAVLDNKGKKTAITEFATTDERNRRVFLDVPAAAAGEEAGGVGGAKPPGEHVVQTVRERVLVVTRTVDRTEDRYGNILPPYYLPQGLSQLLPRLLPLDRPEGYLIVSYLSDQKELMFRYLDVGNEEEVDVLGTKVRAVPIADRIGLGGVPTVHYVTTAGKYVGSRSTTLDGDRESTSWIVPADEQSIRSRWANANLVKPKADAPDAPKPEPSRSEPTRKEPAPKSDNPQRPNRPRPQPQQEPKNPAPSGR